MFFPKPREGAVPTNKTSDNHQIASELALYNHMTQEQRFSVGVDGTDVPSLRYIDNAFLRLECCTTA